MAGNDDTNRSEERPSADSSSAKCHARVWPEDENPFVAFRRFADEQISSILQSVMGLPSMISPPMTERWMIFAADKERERKDTARQRRAEDGSGGGHRSFPESGGSNAEDDDYERSRKHKCRGPLDILGFDSFFDRPWHNHRFPGAFHLFHPHDYTCLLDAFATEVESFQSSMWPMPYLMHSPYSPLQLERQDQYRAQRDRGLFSSFVPSLLAALEQPDHTEPRWREAFEDLLRLENGKPMLPRDSQTVDKRETRGEWLQGLVKRGSLGDCWKHCPWSSNAFEWEYCHFVLDAILNEKKPFDTNDPGRSTVEDNEPDTELALYDRFLQNIEDREREFFHGMSGSPVLRFLLDERRRRQHEIADSRRKLSSTPESEPRRDDTESWLELVSRDAKNSASSAPAPETGALVEPSKLGDADLRVVSTTVTTKRVQLADGTIETYTVKKKRFADGREETNESVDVVAPESSQDSAEQNVESQTGRESRSTGWFWKNS